MFYSVKDFLLTSAHLNRSVSALSYQIQKLEDELQRLILGPAAHRAAFTQVGQILVDKRSTVTSGIR